MSHGPGCGGEAMVRVQGRGRKENKVKEERGTRQGNSTSRSGRGGNREVVSKEISVRIIVACGHDTSCQSFGDCPDGSMTLQ